MSILLNQAVMPAPAETADRIVEVPRATTPIATFQCLVLSASAPRRQMLARSATDAGWDAVVCSDTSNCWSCLRQELFQLVLLDLQDSSGSRDEFREVAEHLANESGTLLVLCGQEGDAMEEIWARQLGVWLYLPGVDRGSDICSLCEAARPVAEKLFVSGRQPTR